MPRQKLTAAAVERIKAPSSGRLEIFDATLPGFGLRITERGKRSWIVLYRHAGRSRRLTLGSYPALSLADAREAAGEAMREVAKGNDPGAEKAVKKATQPDTFDAVADLFVERYARRKQKRPEETERILRKYVRPTWGRRPIQSIKKADVIALLDQVEDCHGIYMCNRTLSTVRKLFNWAIDDRDLIEASPVGRKMMRDGEKPRKRYLDHDEIRAIWKAAEARGYPFGPFVKLLLATGQRRGEVAGMRWADVDLDARVWTLPADDTKAGRQHEVPLNDIAAEILQSIPRTSAIHVFSTQRDRPISGYSRAKRALAQKADLDEPWRLHDLRASMASLMDEDLHLPPHVIALCLNHAPEAIAGITARYMRGSQIEQKRKAMDAWGRHLQVLIEDAQAGNVVDLIWPQS